MDTEGQVRFRDCQCPDTPHDGQDGRDDGDIVWLRPALGFAAGAEALRMILESDGDVNRIAELVGPVYIREGPSRWNLPEPMTRQALEALTYSDAYPIAEAADDLYSEAVLAPLLTRMSAQSGNGQNGKPTRPTRRSSTPRPSRRGSSSQNGSAGKPSPVSP